MPCNGNCVSIFHFEKITRKSWYKEKNQKFCTACQVVVPLDKAILIGKMNRKRCPCCMNQLKNNSKGKKHREERQMMVVTIVQRKTHKEIQ